MILPGQTYSSGTLTAQSNTFGSMTTTTGVYSGSTYTTPASAVPFVKPGMDIVIKMFREGEIDPRTPSVWDADSILAEAARHPTG